MRMRVGTSGFSYEEEWKGIFYPEDLPDAKRLDSYGALEASGMIAERTT